MILPGKAFHNPAEIFGFPPRNVKKVKEQMRRNYECPFLKRTCTKQSRLLSYPLGICSAWHLGTPRIICPNRFYVENSTVLKEASKLFLESREINLVREVGVTGYGHVDWIAYTYDRSRITDFCGIEICSDSTTATGKLVKALEDFVGTGKVKERYNYGLNTYNTIKLSFTQIMNKGQVFEKWGKKYIWILQDVLFENLVSRFNLDIEESFNDNQIIFYTVKLILEDNKIFEVKRSKVFSTNILGLLKAYSRGGKEIPSLESFIDAISSKAGISTVSDHALNEYA